MERVEASKGPKAAAYGRTRRLQRVMRPSALATQPSPRTLVSRPRPDPPTSRHQTPPNVPPSPCCTLPHRNEVAGRCLLLFSCCSVGARTDAATRAAETRPWDSLRPDCRRGPRASVHCNRLKCSCRVTKCNLPPAWLQDVCRCVPGSVYEGAESSARKSRLFLLH
ncbi:hypothetical protein BJ546DRAFT_180000 [Cryomyces antarcticus]